MEKKKLLPNKSQLKTVYCYNHKNLITITRNDQGDWFYEYSELKVSDLFKKHKEMSSFSVGLMLGYKILQVLIYCVDSYGDNPDDFLERKVKVFQKDGEYEQITRFAWWILKEEKDYDLIVSVKDTVDEYFNL